jgi:hypothetical protein
MGNCATIDRDRTSMTGHTLRPAHQEFETTETTKLALKWQLHERLVERVTVLNDASFRHILETTPLRQRTDLQALVLVPPTEAELGVMPVSERTRVTRTPYLSEYGVHEVAELVKNNLQLVVLSITCQRLDDAHMQSLYELLPNHPTLRCLDLFNNVDLDDAVATKLVTLLQDNEALEVINLGSNIVSSECGLKLQRQMANRKVNIHFN